MDWRLSRSTSQPTGRSVSTAEEFSHSDLERWESASGSLDLEGASNKSKDSSSSAATHVADPPAEPALSQQELFPLDEQRFESPSDPSSRTASSERRAAASTQAEASSSMAAAAQLKDDAPALEAPDQAARASEEAKQRPHKFTLHILRCRAMCPDWRDTSFAPGTPREVGEGLYGDALVLDIPELFLQLPAQDPGCHPSMHPVEEDELSERRQRQQSEAAGADQPSAAAAGPSECAEPGWDEPSLQEDDNFELGRVILSGKLLTFHVDIFDPGKWAAAGGPRRPCLSIPGIRVAREEAGSPGQQSDPTPSYSAGVAGVMVGIEPQQARVLKAALDWTGSELAHILGRTQQQVPHMRRRRQQVQPVALLSGSPFTVRLEIERVVIRLRGAVHTDPVLILALQALSAEARRAKHAVSCDMHFASMLLHLSGMPAVDTGQDAHVGLTEEAQQSHSPVLSLGRSASAPNPRIRRRFSGVLEVEYSSSSLNRI